MRPCKCRLIGRTPRCSCFKPAGIPLSELDQVVVTLDEIEALRLADLQGLYQQQAAEQMNVSRQTFGNIVESARRKLADAVTNAKALKIEGGVIDIVPDRRKSGCCRPRHRHCTCPKCRKLHKEMSQ